MEYILSITMSSTRPNIKKVNVSGSVLSRQERCELAELLVKFDEKCHGNSKAPVGQYFGELWYASVETTDVDAYNINISGRTRTV